MGKLIINGATDKGARREINEDAYNFVRSVDDARLGTLAVVADGVGGLSQGDYGATLTVQNIYRFFYAARREGEALIDALERSVGSANRELHAYAQANETAVSCTVVAAVLGDGHLITAHVGDARAYRLSVEGRLERITKDHSWVEEQVRMGLLSSEEAANHQYRNVVTRAVGNKPAVEVEVTDHGRYAVGDSVLLCSDGLYTTLRLDEIESMMTSGADINSAKQLVDHAKPDADDNVTVITIDIVADEDDDGCISETNDSVAAQTLLIQNEPQSTQPPTPAITEPVDPEAQTSLIENGKTLKYAKPLLLIFSLSILVGIGLAVWLFAAQSFSVQDLPTGNVNLTVPLGSEPTQPELPLPTDSRSADEDEALPTELVLTSTPIPATATALPDLEVTQSGRIEFSPPLQDESDGSESGQSTPYYVLP